MLCIFLSANYTPRLYTHFATLYNNTIFLIINRYGTNRRFLGTNWHKKMHTQRLKLLQFADNVQNIQNRRRYAIFYSIYLIVMLRHSYPAACRNITSALFSERHIRKFFMKQFQNQGATPFSCYPTLYICGFSWILFTKASSMLSQYQQTIID